MNRKIMVTQYLKKPVNKVSYGTAGYRSKNDDLKNILCRDSFLAYLRSISFAGKRIGIIITASHNPICYNGIKFIDHNGNMLDKSWERCCDELVNCEDEAFHNTLNKILRMNSNLCDINDGITGHVVIGRDTRESGIEITRCIKEVLSQVDCIIEDIGEVSTPQMHFLIRQSNINNELVNKEQYLEYLKYNFLQLKALTGKDYEIFADTSNGVVTQNILQEFNIKIINDEKGILNEKCGADFVNTQKTIPELNFNFHQAPHSSLYASFDGDADRLILFSYRNGFEMFDGDTQAAILVKYFKQMVEKLNLNLKIGVVLSYYSNGGCIDYLSGVETELVATGVKNFVQAARNYDIGIYFEPNGHGSVLFSSNALQAFSSGTTPEHKTLEIISNIFDPNIGDALANLLVFKCIIDSPVNLKEYKENGSRLLTVKIQNKNSIVVNDKNEVITPKTLQEKIIEEVVRYSGRAFVRPSGTEDLVRVYSECVTQKDADQLALIVAQLVYDMCNGIGIHPEIDYTKK